MKTEPTYAFGEDRKDDSRFSMILCRQADDETTVRSCEVIGRGFCNRTAFGREAELTDVLVPGISRSLIECLKKLSGQCEIRTFPDLFIQTGGLVLAGLKLTAVPRGAGGLLVRCQFGAFMGGLNRAFQRNMGFDDTPGRETERLSAMVFADLVLPLLNLCQFSDDLQGKDDRRPLVSEERREEIAFRVELLKRFLEFTPQLDESADKAGGPPDLAFRSGGAVSAVHPLP